MPSTKSTKKTLELITSDAGRIQSVFVKRIKGSILIARSAASDLVLCCSPR